MPPAPLSFADRVAGCWLGKSVGGTLGLPAEGRPGPLDFTFYDPVPTSAPPNDDLELQLVWLHLLETRGLELGQRDFADAWLAHIHYMWDEYGRCRWNLRRGAPPSAAGVFENWFASGMGSPIRSEIWACLCAGRPAHAAAYAALDSSLDHGPEGGAGEVFLAAMQSLVLDGVAPPEACARGLGAIPPGTETARVLALALRLRREGLPEWDAYRELVAAHGHENFTHAPLNLGLIGWALAYGEGDFERSLLLAANGGHDTDCTAATVGATLGMWVGAGGVPARWSDPIGDAVWIGPGIRGIDAPRTLGELSSRTLALAERFAARIEKSPAPLAPPPQPPALDARQLPGAVWLEPLDGSAPVAWANAELPGAVLAAGGAEWTWTVGEETRDGAVLVALAREGCRLLIDGATVVDCPPGSPFVPAVHRPAPGSRAEFRPGRPRHRMRLELRSRSARQDAAVLLAGPDMHLSAWTGEALPHPARLPTTRPIHASSP